MFKVYGNALLVKTTQDGQGEVVAVGNQFGYNGLCDDSKGVRVDKPQEGDTVVFDPKAVSEGDYFYDDDTGATLLRIPEWSVKAIRKGKSGGQEE